MDLISLDLASTFPIPKRPDRSSMNRTPESLQKHTGLQVEGVHSCGVDGSGEFRCVFCRLQGLVSRGAETICGMDGDCMKISDFLEGVYTLCLNDVVQAKGKPKRWIERL